LPELDSVVLAIMMASDKTQLSTFSGDSNVHPLYVSLGNFYRHQRATEKLELSVNVAIIPDVVPPNEAVGKTAAFRQ